MDRIYQEGATIENLESTRNIAVFLSEMVSQRGGLHFVSHTNNIIMYITRSNLLCILPLDLQSSLAKARIVGESLTELAIMPKKKKLEKAEIDEFLRSHFPSVTL